MLLPGDIETPTGGYLYDRRMVQELRALGWPVEVTALDTSFPAPTPTALAHADRALAALPDGALALLDGLAFGAMPQLAAAHAARLRLVALVHHPLALETGLEATHANRLRDSERAALAQVRAVIVTSPETAATLQRDYAVPAARLAVVEPGTEAPAPVGAARDAGDTTRLRLLCVATLAPRKGHELLLQALAAIEPARRPHLDCLGSTTRDPRHAAQLQALAQRLGLAGDVRFHGECTAPAVAAAFAAADLFVLPSWYEGYGMAVAEAIACGLPVIATAVGAAPRVVGADAGLLVPPGDQAAFTAALRRVVDNPALRRRLAAAARGRAATLPRWSAQAARLARRLAAVAAEAR